MLQAPRKTQNRIADTEKRLETSARTVSVDDLNYSWSSTNIRVVATWAPRRLKKHSTVIVVHATRRMNSSSFVQSSKSFRRLI